MLTYAWTQLRYHELQSRLWRTRARFVAVAAGRGSGKTELARRRVIRFLPVRKSWPNPMYFYALPTVAQAKRVAWRPLLQLIPPDWIKKLNESEMFIETVFGSTLQVLGMDKPHRAEGVQWDGGVIDESSDQKPSVFNITLLPTLSHKNAWCWRIGVPKRAGIGAADFKKFFDIGMEGKNPDHESYTWPSEDILSPEALQWARENMDARDYNEQFRASWEDVSGTIFWAFSDVLNVAPVLYQPNRPIVVGSDFNVDPMCWVIGHRADNGIAIFDELFIRNCNTRMALDELHRRYGKHEGGWEFFGDASSRARKTSATMSDFLQIKDDKRFKSTRVFYPKSNPRIADRFAACNALFCNAAGIRRCFVDPRCKHLIADLKTRAYEPGTNEPDDYGDIGHISDAIGYIIHRLFPIRLSAIPTPPEVSLSGNRS